MQFSDASVTDLLRSSQRDETVVQELQNMLQAIMKLLGSTTYNSSRAVVPKLANAWYYFMTTLGNLQTLGEEYTGTLRFDESNSVPSRLVELLWLLLYIGGEPMIRRLATYLRSELERSTEMRLQAKRFFTAAIDFFQTHQETFKRIHHSMFYINGKYYNISNRVTGIKYVLVRHWLHDETFTQSFKMLGYISLFYILYNFVQQIWSNRSSGNILGNSSVDHKEIFSKGCVLCADNRKNACAIPCGHVFCWNCIYENLSYQQNCPICREVVTPNRVIFLQNYT